MVGPPGSGKTMLAERLPGLSRPLTPAEALTVTRVHSAAGCALPRATCWTVPPFRGPPPGFHRLPGGRGSWSLRPGEVSLATPRVLEMSLETVTDFWPQDATVPAALRAGATPWRSSARES